MERVVFFLAPFLTSIQVMPQVYKTLTTKNVTGVSIHMFILATFAGMVWFAHGYYTQDVAVMASSSMTFMSSILMIGMILLYRK